MGGKGFEGINEGRKIRGKSGERERKWLECKVMGNGGRLEDISMQKLASQ